MMIWTQYNIQLLSVADEEYGDESDKIPNHYHYQSAHHRHRHHHYHYHRAPSSIMARCSTELHINPFYYPLPLLRFTFLPVNESYLHVKEKYSEHGGRIKQRHHVVTPHSRAISVTPPHKVPCFWA